MSGFLIALLPLSAQATSEPQVIINASGGDAGEPGLRIHYANGQLQVYRNGTRQFYWDSEPGSPDAFLLNAVALNLEGTGYSAAAVSVGGVAFANSTQSGGSVAGSGTITGTLDTGFSGFVVAVAITYIHPNEYFTMTLTMDRGTTTLPLKLYHFALPGSYNVPGFSTANPATVGVNPAGPLQAFGYLSGPTWTGHFSGDYHVPWDQVQMGDNFDNTVDTNTSYPKTYGIMWDLGTAAAQQTVSYQMIFSDALTLPPAQMLAPAAVIDGLTATATITPPDDNGSAITGYTLTAAPGGGTCAIGAGATSCAVAGLTAGVSYTFTATATNDIGTSPPSPPSNPVTATAPAAGTGPAATETPPLVLDGGAWFFDIPAGDMATAAAWLAKEGITLGCEGGSTPRFCPDHLASRAEVATLLSRALNIPPSQVDAFTDDDGHLLEDGINRAATAGWLLGCSTAGLVCPDGTITRAEVATVLVRALGLTSPNPSSFADAEQHWAQASIGTVGGLGISIGCTADGRDFCPDGTATRGEIALFLYRSFTIGLP